MAAFRRPLYAGGLITRRSLTRALFGQLVYVHLGANEHRLAKLRETILRITKGWERDEVVKIIEEALEEIVEPRLTRKLEMMTGVAAPKLFAPPVDSSVPGEPKKGIGVWRFPEWFVVQEDSGGDARERSRRKIMRN